MLFFQNFISKPRSLYLHYPLCVHVCSYCDFNVYSRAKKGGPDFNERWISTLAKQWSFLPGRAEEWPLRTLYVGGGSPSLLSEEDWTRLFKELERRFDLGSIEEISVECNPEQTTTSLLKHLRTLGVTRVSMGVQSFQPKSLKRLERLATVEHLEHALEDISNFFKTWSLDLMLGVPEQRPEDVHGDLEKALSWRPPHLSAYLLTIPDDHKWHRSHLMRSKLANEEEMLKAFREVHQKLTAEAYEHYELSNYAKVGHRSRHNSNYWDVDSSYLAFGPGAHGYVSTADGSQRYEMIRPIEDWMRSESGISWVENLTPEQQSIERLYLELRKRSWVQLPDNAPQFVTEDWFLQHFETQDQKMRLRIESWPLLDYLCAQILRR